MTERKHIPDHRDAFAERIESLPGKWTVRERAAYGTSAPLCATCRGILGTVEIWGGLNHANEIWVIGTDKSERLVTRNWTAKTLRGYVQTACSLAGVQLPLELESE